MAGAAGVPTVTMLPNGLKVLVVENHASTMMAASCFIRVGANFETRSTAGLRALLCETMIRGGERFGTTDLPRLLAQLGASLSYTVHDDYVEIYCTGGGRDANLLLSMLLDVVMRPALADASLDSAQSALLAKLALRENNLFGWEYDLYREQVYADPTGMPAGYGLSSLGYADSLRALTRQDLVQFHNTWFTPNNAVLVISGDVSAQSVTWSVRQTTDSWRSQSLPTVQGPVAATFTDDPLVVRERPLDAAWLLVGFPGAPLGSDDEAPLSVAAALVGQGMGSRLFHDLREERQLVYEVTTHYFPRRYAGDIVTSLQTRPLDVVDAESAVVGAFQALMNGPISPEELRRAIQYVIGSHALAHQRNHDIIWAYGRCEIEGVGWKYDRVFPEKVRRVTASDLHAVAKRYFSTAAVVALMPQVL